MSSYHSFCYSFFKNYWHIYKCLFNAYKFGDQANYLSRRSVCLDFLIKPKISSFLFFLGYCIFDNQRKYGTYLMAHSVSSYLTAHNASTCTYLLYMYLPNSPQRIYLPNGSQRHCLPFTFTYPSPVRIRLTYNGFNTLHLWRLKVIWCYRQLVVARITFARTLLLLFF